MISASVSYGRSLIQLCECLRASVPRHVEWASLLGLANQTLTTPALMEFATRFRTEIPEDVYCYIREIFERNVARNDRLLVQLAETVAAINDQGVTPVLLKGAATLTPSGRLRGSRLMSDLDIMVLPYQVEATMKALLAIGYCEHYEPGRGTSANWYAELKRPDDVGMVDLHCELPGPRFFYSSVDDIVGYCKNTVLGQGSAFIPSATYQALISVIHDEFQDNDYWIGNIDMRHLVDLRDLAISSQGIDWDLLASLTPSKLAKNALETQLVALSSLLGVDVPFHMRSRFVPRLQHWRRLTQARVPFLRPALLPLALLDYPNYRYGPGAVSKHEEGVNVRKWCLPKRDSVRFLLRLSRKDRAGKL